MVRRAKSPDLLAGTLDMMILRTLLPGPNHGYAIARRIRQTSEDVLVVEEGSLYPALHRLERRGFIEHEWCASENNRRAKFYRLTRTGRAHLKRETESWNTLAEAVGKVMNARSVAAAT